MSVDVTGTPPAGAGAAPRPDAADRPGPAAHPGSAAGPARTADPEPRPAVAGPDRPRVAVVDDDTLIREGLAPALPDVDVVLRAADLAEFLAAGLGPADVDVVLLDLHLPTGGRLAPSGQVTAGQVTGGSAPSPAGRQGRAAVRLLADAGHRVLIYTSERRPAVLAGCFAAGAAGLVHKTESLRTLRTAIGLVADGGQRVSAEIAGVVEDLAHRGQLPALSPRQAQVLAGRARGETFASIARRLVLSERTVESYMRDITLKFSDHFATHSAADLEQALGIGPGDVVN